MQRSTRRRLLVACVAGALASLVALVGLPADAGAVPAAGLGIAVLSSRPDLVTGGDALVQVHVPKGISPDAVRVWAGGREVSAAFSEDAGARSVSGLVSGLPLGPTRLTATAWPALPAALLVRNYPRNGPLFSGPRETPFVCDTAAFGTVTKVPLPASTAPECTVPTRVDLVYRTTAGAFRPLPAGDARPADLAWTTTKDGRRVPYVVRVETGVIDRSIYELAVLDDPAGWNQRLVYVFGGGCPGGWYQQGRGTGGVMDDVMLRQGYAVASSSLNVFGNNCSDLLAAEVMAMVRERAIERLGPPLFTIGWGCSGGSYQVHQLADNYPGLLDGIIAACSFPDVTSATLNTITDARLLDHYFRTHPDALTADQRQAVTGFGSAGTVSNLAEGARRIDPRVYCPQQLSADQRYDPVKNPRGARCDVYDHTVNVYGRDATTGAALRPLDNVGIRYGLDALRRGVITVEQFLDLNERIGGFDRDADFTAARTVADPTALAAAYRSGRILYGGGGLATTPIIDYRSYTDDLPGGDIHLRFHSFSTRARLAKANGNAVNQVMLVEDPRYGGFTTANPVVAQALSAMDDWLAGMRADRRQISVRERMVRNKPTELVDACWTRDGTRTRIVEPQVDGVGTTRCNSPGMYPSWPAPRQVAGAPVANDIIKCRLRPLAAGDFGGTWTAGQKQRLRTIFRFGVCDWEKPGVGQRRQGEEWISFGPAKLR